MMIIPNRAGFRKGETAFCFDRDRGPQTVVEPILSEFEYPPAELLKPSHFADEWLIAGNVSAGGVDGFLDSGSFEINQPIRSGTDITDNLGNIQTTGTPYTSLFDMIGKPGAEGGANFGYSYLRGDDGVGGVLCNINAGLTSACRYSTNDGWGVALSLTISITLLEDPEAPDYDGLIFETTSRATFWGAGNDAESVTFNSLPVQMDKDENQDLNLTIAPVAFFDMENP